MEESKELLFGVNNAHVDDEFLDRIADCIREEENLGYGSLAARIVSDVLDRDIRQVRMAVRNLLMGMYPKMFEDDSQSSDS